MRALLPAVAFLLWCPAVYAAPDCAPASPRKAGEQIVDWYDVYVKPYLMPPVAEKPDKAKVEALVSEMSSMHRPAVLDPLYFEPLVRQLSGRYATARNFGGIDASVAEKAYAGNTETRYEFSLLCIAPKSVQSPDDAYTITLFGVTLDDCQHVGLRGLVFTETWVNGSGNGQCRPNQIYFRMLIVPVVAGTNSITFLCRKDTAGCAR